MFLVVEPEPQTIRNPVMFQRFLFPILVISLTYSGIPSNAANGASPPDVKGSVSIPNPILFAQVPIVGVDDMSIASSFGNHVADIEQVGRGGDLYIRYPNGTLRNLTREAGYGTASVFQGATSIAVRDPNVHWSGNRALFSMVVGAPTQQGQSTNPRWQIHEVTGLGQGQTVAMTKVAGQPTAYNNVSPIYVPDGRIVYTSDRPRGGEAHLYPQLDEYDSIPSNTGLWSLDPTNGDLRLLQHSPSGSFTPIVDSYGRIIFTRWDHLQRDAQGDADALNGDNGTWDYSDESAGASVLPRAEELFPEPLYTRTDLLAGTNLEGMDEFNHFQLWEILPDGTGEETLNHVGRHELRAVFERVFADDPNVVGFDAEEINRANPNSILNFFQGREDPTHPGRYFGVDCPRFDSHASGGVIRIDGPPGLSADQMIITHVTHPETATVNAGAGADHTGHYRDPLPLSDGQLIAAHTAQKGVSSNQGSRATPNPNYDFRLKTLTQSGVYRSSAMNLTSGISRRVQYYDPDVLVTWDGPLWELQPVEVVSRAQPPLRGEAPLEAPEQAIFNQEGVSVEAFRADLETRGLALMVSRDMTTRDDADTQQPFNLRVAGTSTQTTANGGKLYDISHLQIFQAEQLRGYEIYPDGRRVLARPLRDPQGANPPSNGPVGSVTVGADGSMAALVPARRATAWQLTAPDGTPVVRERYWLNFQPGEVRVCASCHGVNESDQAGAPAPLNPPEALRTLLQHWKLSVPSDSIFADGFESGNLTGWSSNN